MPVIICLEKTHTSENIDEYEGLRRLQFDTSLDVCQRTEKRSRNHH